MATGNPAAGTKSSQQLSQEGHDSKELVHIKSRPSLRSMLSELEQIIDWQTLRLNLGVEKYQNDKIEKNFPQDVDRQKQEAFDRWLRETLGACWKDIIDALFEMKEPTLAGKLTKKYSWKDPRNYVNVKYVSAPESARLTATPVPDDLPCRRFLSPLNSTQQFYTLETDTVQQINERSAIERTRYFTRLINSTPKGGYTLLQFLKSIEQSDCKKDFKVGLEARFGKVYWKFNPKDVLPPNSSRNEWFRTKLLRKVAFNTEVMESDIEQLFRDRERLGKEVVTRITLKFIVEGQRYKEVLEELLTSLGYTRLPQSYRT